MTTRFIDQGIFSKLQRTLSSSIVSNDLNGEIILSMESWTIYYLLKSLRNFYIC